MRVSVCAFAEEKERGTAKTSYREKDSLTKIRPEQMLLRILMLRRFPLSLKPKLDSSNTEKARTTNVSLNKNRSAHTVWTRMHVQNGSLVRSISKLIENYGISFESESGGNT